MKKQPKKDLWIEKMPDGYWLRLQANRQRKYASILLDPKGRICHEVVEALSEKGKEAVS